MEICGNRAYWDVDRPEVFPKSALKRNIFWNSKNKFRKIPEESGSSYERSWKSSAGPNNAARNSNHFYDFIRVFLIIYVGILSKELYMDFYKEFYKKFTKNIRRKSGKLRSSGPRSTPSLPQKCFQT